MIIPEDTVHDFTGGQIISIFANGTTSGRILLNGIYLFEDDDGGNRRLNFQILAVVQNDAVGLSTATFRVGVAGFRGEQGLTGITNITDDRSGTTVTVQPAADGDSLVLGGATVTTNADLHVLENSVVPFSMVIDWVLYTSSRSVVESPNPIDIQGATNVTVITYSQNARIPGTWLQYVGVEQIFDGDGNFTGYRNNEEANTFVSGNVRITI